MKISESSFFRVSRSLSFVTGRLFVVVVFEFAAIFCHLTNVSRPRHLRPLFVFPLMLSDAGFYGLAENLASYFKPLHLWTYDSLDHLTIATGSYEL